jgi:AraC-like DNA-binding protein
MTAAGLASASDRPAYPPAGRHGRARDMAKVTMTCDDLPVGLPDAEMLAAWREQFHVRFGEFGTDIAARRDLPGKSGVAIVPLNTVSVLTLYGKFDQIGRNAAGIGEDGSEELALAINRGSDAMHFLCGDSEVRVEAGRSALFSNGMTGRFVPDKPVDLSVFRLPRSALPSTLQRAGTAAGVQALPAASEPLRMLDSYARVMTADAGIDDPSTVRTISSHLIDLISLALGPGSEEEERVRRTGLRTGRIHTLLREIEAGYLDPGFSIHKVAAGQRVSVRYLQELLAETGVGFGERVLELRLQHAHRLLSRRDQQHRKIIDVAFSSGFNDVSYFTRCFRARFNMTPGDARACATVSL